MIPSRSSRSVARRFQVQLDSEKFPFDVEGVLRGVVSLRTRIPEDALTAPVLGTERSGHGVVISDTGLVLTIGYLIAEANSVWLVDGRSQVAPGHVVAYDQESGLGLVQTLKPTEWPAVPLADSGAPGVGEDVLVAGYDGLKGAIHARVLAKREFAGYWEYVLDEAIFTAPAHPNWGGAALIDRRGALAGIGSLLVQQVDGEGETSGINLSVPVDLLKPVLSELMRYGRRLAPPRPWLGWLVQEVNDQLFVAGIHDNCPADKAGLKVGDVVVEVDGHRVSGLAELFRRIWSLGEAGVTVPLDIRRGDATHRVRVQSVDRDRCLRAEPLH